MRPRRDCGDPFPGDHGAVFRPLDALAAMPADVRSGSVVVLSVGGNDIREILGAMHELPRRLEGFQTNIVEIAAAVAGAGCRGVALQLQYRPSLHMEASGYGVYSAMSLVPGPGTGVDKLHALMDRIYPPVLALARAFRFAVLDLPRTFDIEDSSLYKVRACVRACLCVCVSLLLLLLLLLLLRVGGAVWLPADLELLLYGASVAVAVCSAKLSRVQTAGASSRSLSSTFCSTTTSTETLFCIASRPAAVSSLRSTATRWCGASRRRGRDHQRNRFQDKGSESR
jgi:hypothetical protein